MDFTNVPLGKTAKLKVTSAGIQDTADLAWSGTNMMIQTTYDGSSVNGWSIQTPSYLTHTITTPGLGFDGSVIQLDATGGSQSQRSWARTGGIDAHTTAFVLGHTYIIGFKYRSNGNGPFRIHDRDTPIQNVPANTGNAKYYYFAYTKTDNSWTYPYLLVWLGDSGTVSQVQMDELTVIDIT